MADPYTLLQPVINNPAFRNQTFGMNDPRMQLEYAYNTGWLQRPAATVPAATGGAPPTAPAGGGTPGATGGEETLASATAAANVRQAQQRLEADIKQFNETHALNKAELAQKVAESERTYKESVRQFDNSLAWEREKFGVDNTFRYDNLREEIRQFDQTHGLAQERLGLDRERLGLDRDRMGQEGALGAAGVLGQLRGPQNWVQYQQAQQGLAQGGLPSFMQDILSALQNRGTITGQKIDPLMGQFAGQGSPVPGQAPASGGGGSVGALSPLVPGGQGPSAGGSPPPQPGGLESTGPVMSYMRENIGQVGQQAQPGGAGSPPPAPPPSGQTTPGAAGSSAPMVPQGHHVNPNEWNNLIRRTPSMAPFTQSTVEGLGGHWEDWLAQQRNAAPGANAQRVSSMRR